MARYQNQNRPAQRTNGQRNQEPEPQEAPQAPAQAAQPVEKFSYPAGQGSIIEVAVWENTFSNNGQETAAYSVSFQRSYLHQNEWKVSRSIRAHEVPVLLHALNQAHAWILEAYRH